ncbi:hypothetical protein RSAG8_05276, partial [Rhizoctonia solani AG-8 WAC10335]
MVQWNSARTKVQLRLAVQRLRMVQQKQDALAKKARRDIATLVEKGKLETARVRVENIVTRKLQIATPSPALVDAYLGEIAKGYGIDWSPPPPPNNTIANPSTPKAESIALEADEPEAKAILSPAKFKDSEAKLPDVPAVSGASEPPPSYPAAAASSSGTKGREEDLFKRLENLKRR